MQPIIGINVGIVGTEPDKCSIEASRQGVQAGDLL